MVESQNAVYQQIIARVMKDEVFRQRFKGNPKVVLERELGITFPHDVTVQVHEDTPTVLHLVLPRKPQVGAPQELSEVELEQVGGEYRFPYPCTKLISQCTMPPQLCPTGYPQCLKDGNHL
jgi:hypothetical protein